MTRIILPIIFACMFFAGSQTQANAGSIQTAVKAAYQGPQNPNRYCFAWTPRKKKGTLEVQLKPGCGGPYWVLIQWTDYHTGYDDVIAGVNKFLTRAHEDGHELVKEPVDRFQRRVENGEFPGLEYLLPQTRSAESDTCPEEDKAGSLGCLRPMVTVTTWCRHKDGYRAAVSMEKCRRDPDLEVVETRSR